MIITAKKNVPESELKRLFKWLEEKGIQVHDISSENYRVFGLAGDTSVIDIHTLEANPWIEQITRIAAPYKKANRLFHPEDTIVDVAGVKIGGHEKVAIIGGPCSVENKEITLRIAKEVKKAGGVILRGGAYKPRTSPYSFQGLGSEGIKILKEVKDEVHIPVVSEIMSSDKIDEFEKNVDLIQVGARNMQNFELLKALGKVKKPILLKRGMSNTIEEWLMSAEYILNAGNPNVILCERGIRTFENYTRNTLDLSVIPLIKQLSHLPIIIDPSHATGKWNLVEPVSLAAIAAGADGLIIEVHDDPEHALSDGAQSLKPERFEKLIIKGREIAKVVGRDI